jgi:hypothetical protein
MAKAPVVLNRAAFKMGLERVVDDQEFGRELEARPAATLRSIGVEIPDHIANELDRQPLSQTIAKAFGPPEAGARPEVLPIVAVVVGVHVAVVVVSKARSLEELSLDETIAAVTETTSAEITVKD